MATTCFSRPLACSNNPLPPTPKPIAFTFAGILQLDAGLCYVLLTPLVQCCPLCSTCCFTSVSVPPYCGKIWGTGYHQTEIMKHSSTPTTLHNPIPSLIHPFQMHLRDIMVNRVCIRPLFSSALCANECACVCVATVGGGGHKSALPLPLPRQTVKGRRGLFMGREFEMETLYKPCRWNSI